MRGDSRKAETSAHLTNDLIARLNVLSHKRGVTLFMTLLTAFKALLLAYTGRNDICVATTMSNRVGRDRERVIGPVANTVLICTRIEPDLLFREALARVRASVLQAHVDQEIPFDFLVSQLAEEHGSNASLLSGVSFLVQNTFRAPLALQAIKVQPTTRAEDQALMPISRAALNVTLAQTKSGMRVTFNQTKNLVQGPACPNWIEVLQSDFRSGGHQPRDAVGAISRLCKVTTPWQQTPLGSPSTSRRDGSHCPPV